MNFNLLPWQQQLSHHRLLRLLLLQILFILLMFFMTSVFRAHFVKEFARPTQSVAPVSQPVIKKHNELIAIINALPESCTLTQLRFQHQRWHIDGHSQQIQDITYFLKKLKNQLKLNKASVVALYKKDDFVFTIKAE